MENSSYDIQKVYKEISTINNYFSEYEAVSGVIVQRNNKLIDEYCHYGKNSGNGNCNNDYFRKASSGVIYLLKNLKDKCDLEYDKIAEYAILWLSYKLNIKPTNKLTDLNKFYTSYIVNNNCYNEKIKGDDSTTYKDIIDKKNLMDNNEISKFNALFSILFLLYSEIKNNNLNCKKYSSYPKTFANKFEELNKDSKNIEGSLYTQILSTLSNDYDNLKNKYGKNISCNFPSLPQIEPKKSSSQNIVVNPGRNSLESSGKGFGQMLGETPEGTPSSSSILNTVIPSLTTFSVIPVFLGVAYKYSLFGIDKLFQRQYIRKKLNQVKKKMKVNI
ncbi:CIR protein PIR protein [Plasmodium vinckei vinckei]|uniref:CIR protein PIR protein n=1 Tax=Plasmodium vinckei vinckei TaxID=54757 RepID=A0A449BNV4_PLAVN|nr:CIR protein PIR protein [Plasmodium vinckei vinckei]VEV55120.1 CIR protein PIR protein [Plasmodium vinckei vinckei]